MFWNKGARTARGQQVLDELIDVPAEDRRLHLYRAVAEGDVRAREVEQALRLVSRLDALRSMEIPSAYGVAKARGESASASTNTESIVSRPASRARRRLAMEVAAAQGDGGLVISSSARAADAIVRQGGREASARRAPDDAPDRGPRNDGAAGSDDQKPSIAWLRP